MKLEFDSNGLPKPGPALDAYLAGHVLGWSDGPHTLYEWHDRKQRRGPILAFHNRPKGDRSGRWDNSAFVNEAGEKFYISKPKEVYIPGKHSTTHVFFQIMEAMQREEGTIWRIFEGWQRSKGKNRLNTEAELYWRKTWYCVDLYPAYTKTTPEERIAHAVCCCAWKAMGGEG